jgi:Uma2 family endonuclease
MNWQQACADKTLHDLPYKIELNQFGQIVMSPTRNRRGFFQAEIAHLLRNSLPQGRVLVECGVDTSIDTIVADVAWASTARFGIIKDEFSCSIAPEICVEVLSFSNTGGEMDKKRLAYFAKGAREFWLCNEHGELSFFTPEGQVTRSILCPEFPARIV